MANFPKIAFVKVDSHEVCHILGSNEDDDPTRKRCQLGPAKRKLEIGGNVSFEEPSRLPSACGELRIC